jgi:hypothetical protein
MVFNVATSLSLSLLPLNLTAFSSPVLCGDASVDTRQHITECDLPQHSYANSSAARTKPQKKWVTIEPGKNLVLKAKPVKRTFDQTGYKKVRLPAGLENYS